MYSKGETAQLKQDFWATFGQYIRPQLSADGLKVNWVNYKTGIKHLYFKMEAEKKAASIAIKIAHPDPGIQELYFEQFKELKNALHAALNEDWEWQLHNIGEDGKITSSIIRHLYHVSIFNKNDWPKLISFFKPRIIALDAFWSDARYTFDSLK